jgi:uncharacterized phage protein (TIGR01671 family)
MRDIKFRAWHKYQKTMLYDLYLDFQGNIGIWNYEETEIKFIDRSDCLVLMQYTGVKDKNEVEIYEGDMVKVVFEKKELIGKVEYDSHNTAFFVRGKAINCILGWHASGYISNCIEVIGNIYENPELLEKKK